MCTLKDTVFSALLILRRRDIGGLALEYRRRVDTVEDHVVVFRIRHEVNEVNGGLRVFAVLVGKQQRGVRAFDGALLTGAHERRHQAELVRFARVLLVKVGIQPGVPCEHHRIFSGTECVHTVVPGVRGKVLAQIALLRHIHVPLHHGLHLRQIGVLNLIGVNLFQGVLVLKNGIHGNLLQDWPNILKSDVQRVDAIRLEGGADVHKLFLRGRHTQAFLREDVFVIDKAGCRSFPQRQTPDFAVPFRLINDRVLDVGDPGGIREVYEILFGIIRFERLVAEAHKHVRNVASVELGQRDLLKVFPRDALQVQLVAGLLLIQRKRFFHVGAAHIARVAHDDQRDRLVSVRRAAAAAARQSGGCQNRA